MPTLDDLDDLTLYGALFTDLALWTDPVRAVCDRHGLTPAAPVTLGVPGTCPTFRVGDRWVVKFFGRLFDGLASFQAEREAARLAALDPDLRVARVLAAGELGGPTRWPWPYLIFELIPGRSWGEARAALTPADRLAAARFMGEAVRRLHALPLAGSAVFPNDHGAHQRFLDAQRAGCADRQRAWGTLPAHLVDQIAGFLPPTPALVDGHRPPHLIHADLTADHLLGEVMDGRWVSHALIDFGDALTGGLPYELAALHLDLFAADPRMLGAFLEAYGLPPAQRSGLPRLALAAALLHRFDVFSAAPPERLRAQTLDALAEDLFASA